MKSFFRKLRWLIQRDRKESELREELQFHLEEEAEQRQAEGTATDDARRAARRELGNPALLQEDTRAMWGWTTVEQLGQDLRYALRMMSGNRLFSVLVVLSLALGIGANTAIFSFMDSMMLLSLPVADPSSLVILNWHANISSRRDFVMHGMSGYAWGDTQSGTTSGMFPYEAFTLIQKRDDVFSSVFAHYVSQQARQLNVAVQGQADVAKGVSVSGDYFRGLGVLPAAGRLILADDDRPGAPLVAVVSHAYSQKRFGEAANAVGQSILINNLTFTVLGVTPPEFFGVDPATAPDVYFPMHANEVFGASDFYGFRAERYADPNFYWVQVMGRLRPGVSLAQAQAALAPEFHQWVNGTASTDKQRAMLPELIVKSGRGGLESLRRQYSQPLYILMTLVGLILLLTCANVANLLLSRAMARRREIALRLSLGASRRRVVRQLLTESVLLASMGGVLGLLLAVWGIRFLTVLLANGKADFTLHAKLNWHVLGATAALSVLTGILFGLAPAFRATRVNVMSALKETRTGSGMRHWFGRVSLSHILVAGQIAISLLMLVAAGLFVRTLRNLESIELGFNRENVLLFQLDARKAGHKDQEIAAFYGDLRRKFSGIPGVRNVSLSDSSLIQAGWGEEINLPGKPSDDATRLAAVGPGFFATMQIPILAGRDIEERDGPGSAPAAVINEVFARANFGNQNPLGQHLILNAGRADSRSTRDMEIVGVSRNARYGGLQNDIPPVVYIAYNQGNPEPNEMVYALRTSGPPLLYVNAVRDIVRQSDSRVPVSDVRTQAADIDQTINQQITFAELCTAFAILALAIASVGLYGAVSYSVVRRTGEIGIRMALGAQRSNVLWMILGEVLVLLAGGLSAGLAAALAMSKLVASFLFGMKPNDPLAIAVSVTILLGAALLAAFVPARKASRIDPMNALRHE